MTKYKTIYCNAVQFNELNGNLIVGIQCEYEHVATDSIDRKYYSRACVTRNANIVLVRVAYKQLTVV